MPRKILSLRATVGAFRHDDSVGDGWINVRCRRDYATAAVRLFRLNIGGLYNGPPLIDLRLLEGAKCLRRLLLEREYFLRKTNELLARRRARECLHQRVIELNDNVLGRALWHPDCVPEGEVEA